MRNKQLKKEEEEADNRPLTRKAFRTDLTWLFIMMAVGHMIDKYWG